MQCDYLESLKRNQNDFATSITSTSDKNSYSYKDIVTTMYEMMVVQAEQSVLLIDGEIRKLNYLTAQRTRCGETIGKPEDK